jgi:arsenite-transporting ATPase
MPRSKATSTPDRGTRSPFHPRQYTFIGGKGGVGKTTCAAALGLSFASGGVETLVISTDPAPSLGDALEQRLGPVPRAVRGAPRLHAVEVNAAASLKEFLESRRSTFEEIALRGTWLDREDVSRLLKLSLPGIDEVAALLQLAGFARAARYERIVVDTAPTGHLLRMLEMPAVLEAVAQVFDHMQAKHRVIASVVRGGWIPDRADALIDEISRDASELKALLSDRTRTQFAWVTLPEMMSIEETVDAMRWLRDHGITVETLLVNRVTPPPPAACRWCAARRAGERHAIDVLGSKTKGSVRRVVLPAVPGEPRGISRLSALARLLHDTSATVVGAESSPARPLRAVLPPAQIRDRRIDVLTSETRLVMFGGKGGVGKTTCAAAAALDVARAQPARRVLLLSTDPAHSVGDALGRRFGDVPAGIPGGPANLMVRELDAGRAFAAVRDRAAAGIEELFARVSAGVADADFAGHDRRVMRDLLELAPPGLDELAAIVEVTDTLVESSPGASARPAARSPATRAPVPQVDLIVIDTAPTGHALRLIEMPALVHEWVKALMAILLKYQPVVGIGELGRLLLRLSQGVGRLREMMSDPRRTQFVAVTRAAALPRAETVRLLRRLASARVRAPAVIVNAAGAGTCSRCDADRRQQGREVGALRRELAKTGTGPILLMARAELPPPHGCKRLTEWRTTWRAVRNRR